MTTAPKKFNIDFEGCEENEVLGYAVYRDTLVYLFKMGNTLRGGIYRAFNSAINEWSGPLYIQEDIRQRLKISPGIEFAQNTLMFNL